MIKLSEWGADINKAAAILEKKLKTNPELKAALDREEFKISLLRDL